jgi:hypothetical protein
MANGSALRLLLVVQGAWCFSDNSRAKRATARSQIPLSDRRSSITKSSTDTVIKFRDRDGRLCLDRNARLIVADVGKVYLQSAELAKDFAARYDNDTLLYIFLEQVDDAVRAMVHFSKEANLIALSEERPELRIESFGLPPHSVAEIEPSYSDDGASATGIYDYLFAHAQKADAALFAVHTDSFLKAPHIVVPLLSHLASLSAEDNLKFPIQLKRLSDQFRLILETEDCPIRIHKVQRDHLNTWADAQGKRYAYLDGGVAKIAGLPGTEPTAMRVGIYCVKPGEENMERREEWNLQPFVVGDIIDKNTGELMDDDDQIDLRRLGEAARYTLEPLTGLRFVEANTDVAAVFSHGPLVNQFVMYDEGEPHFLPFLKNEFLAQAGITRADVEGLIEEIPKSRNGKRMWRQFMAVYGYIMRRIHDLPVPFMGVIERGAGTWLASAVLWRAVGANIIKDDYRRKVMNILKRYGISDDFLFGCILAEGEYITPVEIQKNEQRRARDRWQPVVRQYPSPYATILKTTEFSFPFRVEMNRSAQEQQQNLLRLLYHTARLLPRYAFPVGLDIVDKYAKVPQWLSGNISARLAATVLNRAMAEGDARLIVQVRQLLAHTPRDFFYRPKT